MAWTRSRAGLFWTSGRRALIEAMVASLVLALLVGALSMTDVLDRPNAIVYDTLSRLDEDATDDSIVIVGIDNRSLQTLGAWPWPRSMHATLIDRLAQAEVSAVAYDVLFLEPTPDDGRMAAALRGAGNVYLPMAVDPLGENGTGERLLMPLPILGDAAKGLGHVAVTADRDGVVRRLPLTLKAGGKRWVQLAANLAPAALREADVTPSTPVREQAPMLLRWASRPGEVRTFSFVDVMNGEVPASLLRNKRVLVGMTGEGQGDRFPTPSSQGGYVTGVEMQAALLDTLLHGTQRQVVSGAALVTVSLIPLLLALIGFAWMRPVWSVPLAALLAVATLTSCAIAFALNLWVPPVAALVGLAVVYPLWSWRRLAAASAYMASELEAFMDRDEGPPPDLGGDVLSRQVQAMKAALARLRELRRFTSDTVQSLPDATVVENAQGRIVLANRRAAELFQSDLVGARTDDLLCVLAPDGSGPELTMPDGRVLQIDRAALNAASPSGTRIVRLADITLVRRAQRQREEALQLLSHDMRAPQVAILALLADSGAGACDPGLKLRLEDNARLTLSMAESYVDLALAETRPIGHEPFDLVQATIDAVDTLWPTARQKSVSLTGPDPTAEVVVVGDRVLITRALLNLIDNAVKAGPPGTQVGCRVWIEGGEARCQVIDQGAGVAKEALERVMKPFERGTDDRRGFGLGLALVGVAVQRHHGRIAYEYREGSVFTISLPTGNEA